MSSRNGRQPPTGYTGTSYNFDKMRRAYVSESRNKAIAATQNKEVSINVSYTIPQPVKRKKKKGRNTTEASESSSGMDSPVIPD